MAARETKVQGMVNVAENLAAVEARIKAACTRVGRDPSEVRLLPVSKNQRVMPNA